MRKDPVLRDFNGFLVDCGQSPATVYGYTSDLLMFARYLTERQPGWTWEGMDRPTIEAFLVYRVETSGIATAARGRVAIRRLYAWMEAERRIAADPAEDLIAINAQKFLGPVLRFTPERRAELIRRAGSRAHPFGERDRALLELVLGTGLRTSEVSAANVRDLVLQRDRSPAIRVPDGPYARVVAIPPVAGRQLYHYLSEARPKLLFTGHTSPLLFPSRQGGALSRAGIQNIMRRLEPNMSVTRLRLDFLAGQRDAGVPVEDLAALLGHKDGYRIKVMLSGYDRRQQAS